VVTATFDGADWNHVSASDVEIVGRITAAPTSGTVGGVTLVPTSAASVVAATLGGVG
jgi:hypothetical protein